MQFLELQEGFSGFWRDLGIFMISEYVYTEQGEKCLTAVGIEPRPRALD